jgi:hypothetical protein
MMILSGRSGDVVESDTELATILYILLDTSGIIRDKHKSDGITVTCGHQSLSVGSVMEPVDHILAQMYPIVERLINERILPDDDHVDDKKLIDLLTQVYIKGHDQLYLIVLHSHVRKYRFQMFLTTQKEKVGNAHGLYKMYRVIPGFRFYVTNRLPWTVLARHIPCARGTINWTGVTFDEPKCFSLDGERERSNIL